MFGASSSAAEKKVWVDWTASSVGAVPYNTRAICCYSNGQIIYVSTFSAIYKSTNFGTTWTALSGTPYAQATDICCSSDGSFVGFVVGNDKLIYSYNGGSTWSNVSFDGGFAVCYSCSCSADGTKVIVAEYYNSNTYDPGKFWFSADSCGNFNASTPINSSWQIVRMTPDGTKVFGGSANTYTYIYVGTISGSSISWSQKTSGIPAPYNIRSIACSYDGAKVVAVYGSYGDLIKSSDSGNTWTSAGSLYPVSYSSSAAPLALSYDGNTFIGGIGPESGLAYSTNFLTTLQYKQFTVNDDWRGGVAMKSDGSILYAVNKYDGLFYKSP